MPVIDSGDCSSSRTRLFVNVSFFIHRLSLYYIKLNAVRCPYVRTYVRSYVRNAGRGQPSIKWRHNENDVTMIIADRRYDDFYLSSSFFFLFFPRLFSAVGDRVSSYHTSTHDVALDKHSKFTVADTSSLTSYPLSLHPDLSDDGFARRKQRRNRTTFTLQQVSIYFRFGKITFWVFFAELYYP